MLFYCALVVLSLSGAWAQRRPYPIPSVPSARPQQQQQPQQQTDILEQLSEISPDGSFRTKWSTSNGITFEEVGQPKNLGQEVAEEVQGSASWTSPEGEPISITWHADENGAQILGDHVPTAPPVPALIQRALDYIAANPPRSAQDGAYVADDQIGGALNQPSTPSAFQGFNRPRPRPRRLEEPTDASS